MRNISDVFVNSMWIGKIQRPKLLAAIAALPPEAQIALHMKFWEAKSDLAISKRLRVPLSVARKIVGNALIRLQNTLAGQRALLRDFAA